MTVDEFLVWAEGRPGRYELDGGTVIAMSPENVGHLRAKAAVHEVLAAAVRRAGLPCEALPDGATVRVDAGTAYEPDALVYCGPPLPRSAIEVADPVIVVEVLSPSTARHDRSGKLVGYFAVPSLYHYLIVDADRRVLVHHARDGDHIATRILRSGGLHLDPPGIDIGVEDLLGMWPAV
jgi:Uma2 family endonuclease